MEVASWRPPFQEGGHAHHLRGRAGLRPGACRSWPFLVVAFALTSELVGALNPRVYQHTLESILPLGREQRVPQHHITAAIQSSWKSNWARCIGLVFAVYTSFSLMNQVVRSLLFIFDDSRHPFEWNLRVFSKTVALLAVWTFLLLAITVSSVLAASSCGTTRIFFRATGRWRATWVSSPRFTAPCSPPTTWCQSKRPEAARGRVTARWSRRWAGFSAASPSPTCCWPLLNLNLVYQALGSIVVILFWAQACAWSLIIGACWMVRFKSGR